MQNFQWPSGDGTQKEKWCPFLPKREGGLATSRTSLSPESNIPAQIENVLDLYCTSPGLNTQQGIFSNCLSQTAMTMKTQFLSTLFKRCSQGPPPTFADSTEGLKRQFYITIETYCCSIIAHNVISTKCGALDKVSFCAISVWSLKQYQFSTKFSKRNVPST